MNLIEASFFGDYQTESLQDLLDEAYRQFRAFCRQQKISCSQPPFTVKLAAWQLICLMIPCSAGFSISFEASSSIQQR